MKYVVSIPYHMQMRQVMSNTQLYQTTFQRLYHVRNCSVGQCYSLDILSQTLCKVNDHE